MCAYVYMCSPCLCGKQDFGLPGICLVHMPFRLSSSQCQQIRTRKRMNKHLHNRAAVIVLVIFVTQQHVHVHYVCVCVCMWCYCYICYKHIYMLCPCRPLYSLYSSISITSLHVHREPSQHTVYMPSSTYFFHELDSLGVCAWCNQMNCSIHCCIKWSHTIFTMYMSITCNCCLLVMQDLCQENS